MALEHRKSGQLVLVFNLAVLSVAYAAMIIAPHRSTQYQITIITATVFVAAVAVFTFSRTARTGWLRWPASSGMRTALAVAPWILLSTAIAAKGLWWAQRPTAIRLFLMYALANWSIACCVGLRTWESAAPRRAVLMLAGIFLLLAIDGAAFGVTPYGCVISTVLAGVATVALAIVSFGSHIACLRMFVASVAAGLAVGGLEIPVRLLHIGHNVQEADSREYAREFYTLTPPRSAFVNTPNTLDEFSPALIAINSMGIRGPELAEPRADLLVIGDSMIEARQLPLEATLGAKLQTLLQRRNLPRRVVAHGMRGWSPLLEWNWYLKVGRGLHPRTVMLFFFWNDLWTAGDEASTFSAALRPDGRPDHFNVPVDSNWIWYKHLRVIRLAADVWHRLSVEQVRRSFTAITAQQTSASTAILDDASAERLARRLNQAPLTTEQLRTLLTKPESDLNPELRLLSQKSLWPSLRPWTLWTATQKSAAALTERELQHFTEDVAADGGRLVVVYVPNPLQVGPSECSVGRLFERVNTNILLPPDSGIQTWLRGVADRHGIELLDPTSAMRELDRARAPEDSAPFYLRADCHWSERGHEFMAGYVADWYQRHAAR